MLTRRMPVSPRKGGEPSGASSACLGRGTVTGVAAVVARGVMNRWMGLERCGDNSAEREVE